MEIGRALREAREARGLSLEKVEEETKIRKKFILAMEEERFEQLPGGPVYVRAFLKSYARSLNLPVDELLDSYTSKNESQVAGKPPEAEVARQQNRDSNATAYPWRRVEPASSTEEKSARERLVRLYAAIAVALVGILISSYLATGGMGLKSQPEKPELGGDPISTPGALPEQGPLTIANRTLSLILNVTNTRSWMRVEVDGSPAFEGELAAGQSKNFEAKEKIWIKLGNAAAVEVTLNGKNLGYLGPGTVVEREFTAPGG